MSNPIPDVQIKELQQSATAEFSGLRREAPPPLCARCLTRCVPMRGEAPAPNLNPGEARTLRSRQRASCQAPQTLPILDHNALIDNPAITANS